MSTELSLSIKILLVLNPSIISMMNRGSSCGYFTPLVSSSEKTMFVASCLRCFVGGIIWTLLTCLYCDFLRDLKEPLVIGPSLIILISPIAFFGPSRSLSSSFGFSFDLVCSFWFSSLYVFFVTILQFPFLDQLLKVSTLVIVMPMVSVEVAILFFVLGTGWATQWLQPF